MKHKLAERLCACRKTLSEQLKVLRRARRLYIAIVHNQIIDTQSLDLAASRMLLVGLYSQSNGIKSVRFSVLRAKWKLETGGRSWHQWCRIEGWQFYDWTREERPFKNQQVF